MNGWRASGTLDLKGRPSLRQNLVLLVACFAFAVVLWIYVVGSDPTPIPARPEMRVYNDVLLSHSRSAAFNVVAPAVSSVTVTLRGRSLPDSPVIRASVDVSRVQSAGLYRLPVIVQTSPEGDYSALVAPETVSTFVDTLQSRATTVSFVGLKEPPDEYLAGSPAMDPETVTVSGPASLVARAHAVVSWDLSHASGNVDSIVPVHLIGVAGSEQHLLKVSPERIRLFIPVHRQRAYAVLPVNPSFTGSLAAEYNLRRADVRPPVLTVSGAPDAIAGLGSIPTADIALSDLRHSTTRRVPLALPAGVRSESGSTVQVHIVIIPAPPHFVPPSSTGAPANGSQQTGTQGNGAASSPARGAGPHGP